VLSCDAIAAELRQGTDLLQSVGAAHPARHASIEVVFDQSWRLLGSIERDVLARLSVFRGGFTAEAARAVAAAALPVLGALADKSLLRKDGARLFMHPLVQQLAALRLGDGEARAATERAHARYFDRLLTQSRRAVADGDRDAMQRVDAEFGNCRLAWRWSIANGATDALAKSAPALVDFCDHRGRYEEGLTLLNEALEPKAAGAAPAHETLLLSKAAHLEYRLDRYAQAEARAARALAMAEAAGDDDAKLLCLKVLGTCCQRVGRNDDARRYFEQALQLAPESVDPHNAAAMYDHLALVEKATGRYDEALRLSLQSLAQHRHLGDVAGEALCLNNLAALYLAKRDFVAAGAPLREGLALCDRHGLVSTRGFVLANLTEVALETDDVEAAEKYARRALETVEATGHRSVVCFLRLQLMRLALRRDDFAGARAELAAALTLAIEVARPALLLAGVICFAELLLAQGENHAARRVMTFAQDHPAIGAPERDEIQARLARLPSPPPAEPDWPAMGLEELVQRVVIESSNAHAALIAALRTAV
jgi:tetratricopeptide (TPR) repeat protein